MSDVSETREVRLLVNGREVVRNVAVRRLLADFLREDLGLTATRLACEHGVCGACTVIVDGRTIYSCLTLAISCEGKRVETIESLAVGEGGTLHPVQQAFIEHDAYQCGFCTPGQVMSIVALLRADPSAREDDVKRAVSGNLCRCGAYANIVAAGVAASKKTGTKAR